MSHLDVWTLSYLLLCLISMLTMLKWHCCHRELPSFSKEAYWQNLAMISIFSRNVILRCWNAIGLVFTYEAAMANRRLVAKWSYLLGTHILFL